MKDAAIWTYAKMYRKLNRGCAMASRFPQRTNRMSKFNNNGLRDELNAKLPDLFKAKRRGSK